MKRTSTNFHPLFSPLFSTVKRISTNFHPLFFPFFFYGEKNLYNFSHFILPLYFLLLKEPLQILTLYSSPLFSTVKRTSTNLHPLFFSFNFLLFKEPLQIFTLYSSPLFPTVKRTYSDFHPLFFSFIFYCEKNLFRFSPFILPLYFLLWKRPLQIFTIYSSPLFFTVKRTSTNFHSLFFSFIFYCEKNLYKFSPFILPLYFLLWKGPLQIFTLYSSPLFSTVKRTSTNFHPLFLSFIFYCLKYLYKFSPFILPLYFLLWKGPL